MTYAKITLIGNLGADPELAFDNQNRPRLSMRVAVSERARTAGGEEKTTWYRVTIFGRAGAEAIRLRALQGAAMAPAPTRTAVWLKVLAAVPVSTPLPVSAGA